MTVIQQTLETPLGHVEYCDIGTGPPILYFHGTGVGNDGAVLLEKSLLDSGYRLIVPNRPGYHGTTLGLRGSADFCANLTAHVLNHLQIRRAVLIGTSGGGMPAARFARIHASRTTALILQCAQAHRWDNGIWLPNGRQRYLVFFRYRMFVPLLRWQNRRHWHSAQRKPLAYLQNMSGIRFGEVRNNLAALDELTALVDMGVKCAARPAGVQNDWAMLVGENAIEKNAIACPTLIIHDPHDPLVPFAHAEWSHQCIPQSQLLQVHAGGHLIWHGRDARHMHEQRLAFIDASIASTAGAS